jgi:hypothetical protein
MEVLDATLDIILGHFDAGTGTGVYHVKVFDQEPLMDIDHFPLCLQSVSKVFASRKDLLSLLHVLVKLLV